MKKRIGSLLIPLFLLRIPTFAEGLPQSEGLATYETVCGACHGADVVIGLQASRARWEDTVAAMRDRGASATDADFKKVTDYLAKYFGLPVNVNSATPSELEKELGLKKSDVTAIVAARTAAKIPTFEALAKTPGLNVKELTALKERLKF